MGRKAKALGILLVLLSVALAGCTSSSSTKQSGSKNQGKVYLSHGWTGTTKTEIETPVGFDNPSGKAYVSTGISLSTGRLTITVKDASGNVVHSEEVTGTGASGTSALRTGTPGRWTLQVQSIAATGSGGISIYGE